MKNSFFSNPFSWKNPFNGSLKFKIYPLNVKFSFKKFNWSSLVVTVCCKMYTLLKKGGIDTLNKTGTSKVGAISKAQKAQKTFFEKKLEIFEFVSFRKCRIVPKNVKGGPFGLY